MALQRALFQDCLESASSQDVIVDDADRDKVVCCLDFGSMTLQCGRGVAGIASDNFKLVSDSDEVIKARSAVLVPVCDKGRAEFRLSC